MPEILYAIEPELASEEFVDVLRRSTLAERRPVEEPDRIDKMLRNASLIVTARCDGLLVGVARSITDEAFCNYLSDLAVDEEYQGHGIGKELVYRSQAETPNAKLILIAAPKAQSYYPHIGMDKHPSCWTLDPIEQGAFASSPNESTGSNDAQPSNSSAAVAEFFDSISDEYAGAIRRCVPRYDEMLWALLYYLPKRVAKPSRILELGCGTGNLSLAIAKRFPEAELTAVDLSQSSLDLHAKRFAFESDVRPTNVNTLCKDMRELDFGDGSFDLILSTIALHHLTGEEKQDLFQSCHRWLTPQGVLSYSDQFAGDTPELYEQHMSEWKRASTAIGATEEEWEMWMRHQADQDHHDSLPNQIEWLKNAGFCEVDCVWRHILWTVLTASKCSSQKSD